MSIDKKLFDVPNLDDLSVDPDDYTEAARVFDILQQYAKAKEASMRNRLADNVGTAARIERYMEGLYGDLPAWARW